MSSTLPVIQAITADVKVPSTQNEIKIKQMLTKDEKIILTAKADVDNPSIAVLKAVCQVVQNCIVTPGIDVSKLALFDVEYLFIKLRELSVSNVVEASYRDNEEGEDYQRALEAWNKNREAGIAFDPDKPLEPKPYDFKIELKDVVVKFPENTERTIKTNNIVIGLKYPDASLYSSSSFLQSSGQDTLDQLILNSIGTITQGEESWDMSAVTVTDLKNFLDNMPIPVYDKIKEFLGNLPTVYYKISYKNVKGSERNIELRSLSDFFLF